MGGKATLLSGGVLKRNNQKKEKTEKQTSALLVCFVCLFKLLCVILTWQLNHSSDQVLVLPKCSTRGVLRDIEPLGSSLGHDIAVIDDT